MKDDPRTPEAIAAAAARSQRVREQARPITTRKPKSPWLRNLERKQSKAPRIQVVEIRSRRKA